MGLMTMLSDTSSNAIRVVFPLITGIGMGCLFQTPIIGLQAAMPLKDRATTTATFILLRLLGGTVGVSIGQAVYTSQLSQRLRTIPDLPPGTTAQSLAQEVRRINFLHSPVRQEVRHAFARSISAIWIVNTPIIGVGLILVLFMRRYSLHSKTRSKKSSSKAGSDKGSVKGGGKTGSVKSGQGPEGESRSGRQSPAAKGPSRDRSAAGSPVPGSTRASRSAESSEKLDTLAAADSAGTATASGSTTIPTPKELEAGLRDNQDHEEMEEGEREEMEEAKENKKIRGSS